MKRIILLSDKESAKIISWKENIDLRLIKYYKKQWYILEVISSSWDIVWYIDYKSIKDISDWLKDMNPVFKS